MSDTGQALWLLAPKGPFELRAVPRPTPGSGEVVIRVRAAAMNPVDAIVGNVRRLVTPWVRYPTIIGSDIAGEITEVGAGVTRLRPGDRVVGFAVGQERWRNTPDEGGFQQYVVVLERVCTPLPDQISFEQAAVIPLGMSTAAAGLFEADQLGLPVPAAGAAPSDDVVLVWGASTSVGCNAVQLARASGFAVLATAGSRNHALIRSLGAETVIDYRDAEVDTKIADALGGRRLAGTIAIGAGALSHALHIVRRVPGSRRIASAYPDPVTRTRSLAARARGIRVSSIWGGTPAQSPVGPAIFCDFLPDALADGRFRPAPAPSVFGSGLEQIPGALAELRRGVSAAKIVVTIDNPEAAA